MRADATRSSLSSLIWALRRRCESREFSCRTVISPFFFDIRFRVFSRLFGIVSVDGLVWEALYNGFGSMFLKMASIQRSGIFIFHGFIRPPKGSEILSPNSPLRFRCRCRGGHDALWRPSRRVPAELYMVLCTATPTISTTTTTTADDHEDRTHDIDS